MPSAPRPPTHRRRSGKKDDDAISAVLEAVASGVPDEHAAAAGGISRMTWWRWKKADPALQARIELAESKAIALRVAQISKAANDGNWTAAAWYLERRHKKLFGRNDRADVLAFVDTLVKVFIEAVNEHVEDLKARQRIRSAVLRSLEVREGIPPGGDD
jgi:uncharacterized protein (DUF2384 family)